MKQTSFFAIFFFFLLVFSIIISGSNQQENVVLLVEISDEINQATTEMIIESFKEAEQQHAQAIILLLNTPGGGLQQTFDIADHIKSSSIPVIGFVYPSGATAWSAGTFILLSTHIAVMANHTIIGSCQPVEITVEGTRFINDSKIINALTAWMSERAAMYNRNGTLAQEFITKNRNVNATEAYTLGVIEYTASSVEELLEKIDTHAIRTSTENKTLHTKNASLVRYAPSFKIQIMNLLSNSVLSSLLLMIGIFSLIFGISTPGHGAEVFGGIAILLSLIGSGFSLPLLSILFIVVGCLLLIIELFALPGFGVVGIGGTICLVIGSIFLIPSYPNREWLISSDYMTDALLITLTVVIFFACFFLFLLYKVIQIRRKRAAVGVFIGETATTVDRITPEKPGFIRFKGELWQARADQIIEPNTKVTIIKKDETTLIVKPKEP
ncbi:MAG: nodulation protein NfeD [Candidatus Thermoplasmatota archaeon]